MQLFGQVSHRRRFDKVEYNQTISSYYVVSIWKLTREKVREGNLSDLSPKKIRKFWWKLKKWWMFFINSSNFAPPAFLTLASPSSYALNLNALIKESKVSWRSQLLYEILRSLFERKFLPKKLLLSHSGPKGLKRCTSNLLVSKIKEKYD